MSRGAYRSGLHLGANTPGVRGQGPRLRRRVTTRPVRLLPVLAGLAAAAGQAPLSLPFLALAGLAATVWLVSRAPDARAALLRAWGAGAGYFAGSLFWIVEPFLVDVARHGWMAPFALAGLAAGLALFWAAAGWAAHRLGRTPGARALAFAALMGLVGLARGYVLTGFPWALPGHIWVETPVAQLAALAGAQGLNLGTWLMAVLPVLALARRGQAAGLAATLALIAGGWSWGAARLASPPVLRDVPVRLVQPNAAQHLKWQADWRDRFLARSLELTATPAAVAPQLVVWPETSVPYRLDDSGDIIEAMRAAAPEAVLVFGIQRESAAGWHNSLVVVEHGIAPTAIYDKHHLVPFGEYMPFDETMRGLGLVALASTIGGGFEPGPPPRVIAAGAAGWALPLICYEAVFPQHIWRAQHRPDLIVHITNDAWFGQVAGPYQHLAQARLRAIEQGLPVLRAANTGISAVIDPLGRVIASLPLGQAGVVDAALPAALPPTLFARAHDRLALAGVVLMLFAALALRLRRRTG